MTHPECPATAVCACRDGGRRALLDELYEAVHGETSPAMPIPPVELWQRLILQVRLRFESKGQRAVRHLGVYGVAPEWEVVDCDNGDWRIDRNGVPVIRFRTKAETEAFLIGTVSA